MSSLPEHYQSLPYRPCVGLMLLNKNKQVFVGERIDSPGSWQMPQGGIDDGETVEQAALRELKEEVGTNAASIIKIAHQTLCYDLPAERIPAFWNGRYRGQEQSWIALQFDGKDEDIILDSFHEPEFSRWQWATPSQAIDLIVPFKKELYQQVFTLFSDLV